ncbi:hypothetical protein K8I28_06045 [bacterium]|nr:hypothetical protein [bacterium]
MSIYKQLDSTIVHANPQVWISRIAIVEPKKPEPNFIRDIRLSRGLNIIWAEESENNRDAAEITGHSAGKTTLCRLIRYLLGEKTFGTRISVEMIRKAFPTGCVCAEIMVRGKAWAVQRPIGSGRNSYIVEDATIEDLLENKGKAVSQEHYVQELGLDGILNEFETGGIVQTGEDIQWQHLLAWATRDQESRFQNIHDWRSPRSESESPGFRFPKAGPLFVMRTALGLFLPGELKGEERLAELQKLKDDLHKKLEDKRREPLFRVNLYDLQLRELLKDSFPDDRIIRSAPFHSDDLFPEDLTRLTARAIQSLEDQVTQLEENHQDSQNRIDRLGAEIAALQRELDDRELLFDFDTAINTELEGGLSRREELRKKLDELRNKACPVTDVPFKDCTHVMDRQNTLKITEVQDEQQMVIAKEKREEELKLIDAYKSQATNDIEGLKNERTNQIEHRKSLSEQISEEQRKILKLSSTLEELSSWNTRTGQQGAYPELDELRNKLTNTEKEIESKEKELAELLKSHDQNRQLLESVFTSAVKAVLTSGNYTGVVDLENRELNFRIQKDSAMTGEAVETLSVLLADISCLIYNSISEHSRMPGFVVHDSPREADLGLGLYHSFIRLVADLQAHFDSPDACPFQYILTTTTRPPDELKGDRFVKLKLNATPESEMLLKKNVSVQDSEVVMDLVD